ncbi:MAG: InlB B-repeat-containing protein [Lachnospiraceae bacterium]|nr:InlB B-repeat-containing protein [Lachnospiraceae bacterium]
MKKRKLFFVFLFMCFSILLPQTKVLATENDETEFITITYICNDITKTETIHPGETLDLWIPEEVDGVTLAYWITNPGVAIEDRNIVTSETVFYEDTTLYPVWKPPVIEVEEEKHPVLDEESIKNLYPPVEEPTEYYVRFVLEDGSYYCTIAVDKNTAIEFFPIEPEKDGYVFVGWYTEKNKGIEVNQKNIITSDMTLYAHWEKVPKGHYLIKFNKNYGTEDLIICELVSKKLDYFPNATRKGYKFKGWYTAKKGGKKIKFGKKAKANMTVYAHWTKVTVKKASIKSLSMEKNKLTVNYKKVSSAQGYQVQVSTSKKFKKKATISKVYKKNQTFTRTVSKLKPNKIYYVRVRAYKKDSTNAKVYGKWSKVKKIRVQS